MKQQLANGETLYYEEFGSGSKVLLCTQRFFFSGCHMELLGRPPYDYHVYLITMRGCGESGLAQPPYERNWAQVWGQDVLAFADALGIERFYYSGVSHGCWAGWYIAMNAPQRLLGFSATSGVAQWRPAGQVQRPQAGLAEAEAQALVGNTAALKKMAWHCECPTQNPQRLARRQHCCQEHLQTLHACAAPEFLLRNTDGTGCGAQSEAELLERLSTIPVPVQIINGMRDDLSTPEKALLAARAIPGAQLLIYENLDHGGPDECPEEIARACHRFFEDTKNRIL